MPVEALGDKLGVGERQVRRLFARHLGVSPVAVAQARRLAAAVTLIDAGDLPMAEVAAAAGFGSVRRFNEVFAAVHGETPLARRKRTKGSQPMHLTLTRYAAPLAELLLVTDAEGRLRALDFADYDERMHRLLARHYGQFALAEGPAPATITKALDAYFAGDLTALDAIPVATGGTAFQQSVWAALRTHPGRRNPGLWRARRPARQARRRPRRGARQRPEPHRHRRALPPRHRCLGHADGLCRRGGAQGLAPRP